MATFTVHQAKTELSKLMARAEAGEEIVIARRDKPAVKLVPVGEMRKKERIPGALKGMFKVPDNVFDPLPEDELQAWDGKYSFEPDK
ncbi:type II toxin-antitoxin system prevent-host-death family antitoxin [Aurantimonas sp. C2-6-R+9]|uniref:type II toxin-antitoxin system Phd/YefM family antitoxin n=1 Tax=unclassified Aurantimonas TaxID=2638230 RepID=UPI002E17B5A1|nr:MULTISPECIES: type II toxin-antitoxin system prevent-host-death family antitoxin [unclassified Aurantimonas]MEC5290250.1 type II toxin-antitoxin system prevent-host-death family antitoxin [Aurantimonas sp. C2-3-R2]MEC5321687.1 type II toxin-antitoxin system prevent-host-death family antitoxin [Aurantimonas sp. A3-2-R12]MEC5380361.1 type II toxin-antitoxin system prevent-host-death family antitoxin [Aurantimonas sp. C2-6-R+9]MEC5411314.1 type II toxin-antitoxin system prevent-host-death famil